MRGSRAPPSDDERPPLSENDDSNISLTKEEKDKLLEELAEQSIRGEDPEEYASRGPIKEMIQEGVEETVYVTVNLFLNLLYGEWIDTDENSCDCDGPCHHDKKPFSWVALLDLLRLFMLALPLVGSYILFHTYLHFPSTVVLTVDMLLLSLYVSVLVHHTIQYWAAVVEEFRRTRGQLRH